MPNWCTNNLSVTGDFKQVQEFYEKSKNEKGEFTLNGLHPLPSNIDENEASAMPGWYSWRVNNWGTKWDVDAIVNCEPSEAYPSLEVSFDSAWSPPVEWLRHVAALYPELEFRMDYMEPGMAFCGVATGMNGEVHDEEGEITETDADGEEVRYDSEIGKYRYVESNEIIDDEDFYPEYQNSLCNI